MNRFIFGVVAVLQWVGLSGCSYMENYDRREQYLIAETSEVVSIPEGLDEPEFTDALQIPEVIDSRRIAGQVMTVGLPPTLSSNKSVEAIVLRTLGDIRWIFLDTPPALVWPKIRRFWEEKNLEIQLADPATGVIESTWLTSVKGDKTQIYNSLISGKGWVDASASLQNKLRLTIEPGIRSESSEVYLEIKQLPLTAPIRPDPVPWDGGSDNEALEAEILTQLAMFLGQSINERVISYGAIGLQTKKAILVPDAEKPVLNYQFGFDRAWATVASALKNAGIEIEDVNRSSAEFYIVYSDINKKKSGFLKKVFSREDDAEQTEGNRYIVKLDVQVDVDVVAVTVLSNAKTPAAADIAETLLKTIRESST
ncbi:MAG: outer membrane protein assembly factor BamC [Pseudomonadales bacterium]|nr:outer membrane protein assembly factor BamC [Pseudomonadales bacterium]